MVTALRRAVTYWPAALALLAYAGSVLLANVLIDRVGIVDVAPGPWVLMAPAGVYAVGLGLVARDVVHKVGGIRLALPAIALGVVLSIALADPIVAVASGAAFALSELLDLAIYVPVEAESGWTVAALASSLPALVLDSVVFLWLAFGSLAFLFGQVVGKVVAVLLTVLVLAGLRWLVERRHPLALADWR